MKKKYQKRRQKERSLLSRRTGTARNGLLAIRWSRTRRSYERFGRAPRPQCRQDPLLLPLAYHTEHWERSVLGKYGEPRLGARVLLLRKQTLSRLSHNRTTHLIYTLFRAPCPDYCTNGTASSMTCNADRRRHHGASWIFRISTMQGVLPSSRL